MCLEGNVFFPINNLKAFNVCIISEHVNECQTGYCQIAVKLSIINISKIQTTNMFNGGIVGECSNKIYTVLILTLSYHTVNIYFHVYGVFNSS